MEYDVVHTPRLRKLSRVRLRAEPGGPWAISALSHVLVTVFETIRFDIGEGAEVESYDAGPRGMRLLDGGAMVGESGAGFQPFVDG